MAVDERYKLLYEVTKIEYAKEGARFARIEDKTSKLLTFLAIIIVATTTLATNFRIIDLVSLSSSIEYYIYITILSLVLISILFCFFFAWKCYGIVEHKNLPTGRELFDTIDAGSENLAYYTIAKSYSSYTKANDLENERKANYYKGCYLSFVAVMLSFIFFIVSLVVIVFTKNINKVEAPTVKNCIISYSINQINR